MPQANNLIRDALMDSVLDMSEKAAEIIANPAIDSTSVAEDFQKSVEEATGSVSEYKAAVPQVIADVKKYIKDRNAKLKDSLFETVLAAERQAWIDEHKYPMPSKVRRMVESKIRRAIKKGRLVVDDLGRPRWRGKNVQ